MKILRLIPPLLLSLILVGCSNEMIDFLNKKSTISLKTQSFFDKEKKQAKYKIIWFNTNSIIILYNEINIVMPEDFGDPGDTIVFENGKMTVKKER